MVAHLGFIVNVNVIVIYKALCEISRDFDELGYHEAILFDNYSRSLSY